MWFKLPWCLLHFAIASSCSNVSPPKQRSRFFSSLYLWATKDLRTTMVWNRFHDIDSLLKVSSQMYKSFQTTEKMFRIYVDSIKPLIYIRKCFEDDILKVLIQWFLTFFASCRGSLKLKKISTDTQSVNKCYWWIPKSLKKRRKWVQYIFFYLLDPWTL